MFLSFNIARIQNLTANPLKYKPAVNQVELNFWNPQPELLKWSKENGLLLEAYSPLGSNNQVKETLSVPEVKEIAEKLHITPAQVIISWHVQRGVSLSSRLSGIEGSFSHTDGRFAQERYTFAGRREFERYVLSVCGYCEQHLTQLIGSLRFAPRFVQEA